MFGWVYSLWERVYCYYYIIITTTTVIALSQINSCNQKIRSRLSEFLIARANLAEVEILKLPEEPKILLI